ncbi:hypothetical protein V1478_008543, partial [Vespula squamosa]
QHHLFNDGHISQTQTIDQCYHRDVVLRRRSSFRCERVQMREIEKKREKERVREREKYFQEERIIQQQQQQK